MVRNTVGNINSKSTTPYIADVWYYVAGTYTSTVTTIQVNETQEDADVGTSDWSDFPSTNLEVGRRLDTANHFDGKIDEIRISNIKRNQSWLDASFHSQNQTTGYMTYGSPVSVTSIAAPQDLEASTVAIDEIALTWTRGAESNYTYIRRSYTDYPATVEDGTLVCNITGESYNDVGLASYVRVYYRAWAYNESTNTYSLEYDENWNRTGPGNPTDGHGTTEENNLNVSWTIGRDASHTLVIRKVDSYPTSRTDGTEIYNGTDEYYVDTNALQTYHYRLYSYDDLINLYSDGVNAPWGALDVNCYDEDTLESLVFNALVTDISGDEAYYVTNCTNTYRINSGNLPQGENIGVQISAYDDYNNITENFTGYPHYQNSTTTYIQLQYPPLSKITTNVTTYNSSGNSEDYPQFIITDDIITIYPNAADEFSQVNISYVYEAYGQRWYYMDLEENQMYSLNAYLPPSQLKQLYILQVYDVYDNPVEEAKLDIKRFMNNTLEFVNISIIYTDSSGSADVFLIPSRPHKIIVSADGYDTKTFDFTPDPTFYGVYYPKILKIYGTTTTEPEVEAFWNLINFNATIYINQTIYVQFNVTDDNITNAQFYTYELFNFSSTLNATNTTTSNTFAFWVRNINISRQYEVTCHLNHTVLGYVVQSIIINPIYAPRYTDIEAKIRAVFGNYNLGFVNIFFIYIPAIVILVIFSRTKKKGIQGIGVIGSGLWMGYIGMQVPVPTEALALVPFIIAIGFILIFIKGGSENI